MTHHPKSIFKFTEQPKKHRRGSFLTWILCLSAALGFAAALDQKPIVPDAQEVYRPTWESLTSHPMPEWLLDAKFGIYAHWGVYSVPAFETEWYAKRMYEQDSPVYKHHLAVFGNPSRFGYKDFIPQFRAEKYNPADWAELIEASGARYAGMAVVHHDGFLLWDSNLNRWNAKRMGPKRDVYGELVVALRQRGLKTIATEHHLRTFNWYVPGSDGFGVLKDSQAAGKLVREAGWDLNDPRFADLYWNELAGKRYADFLVEWQAKVREVIDKYQPDLFWFDGGDFRGKDSEKIVLDLLCHYHNRSAAWKKPVEVLNKLAGNKIWNFVENYGMLTFEEGRDREAATARPWIDDMKISDKGWGYIEGQKYKAADEIVDGLVDRVARGGGLLLNLSPKADGTIPDEQKQALREVGAWLKVNGEAIYGTRPWSVSAEGDEVKLRRGRQWVFLRCDASDIRFTRSKDGATLYVICLGVPQNELRIKSLRRSAGSMPKVIKDISLLGSDQKIEWKQEAEALIIRAPANVPCRQAAAFKVMLE